MYASESSHYTLSENGMVYRCLIYGMVYMVYRCLIYGMVYMVYRGLIYGMVYMVYRCLRHRLWDISELNIKKDAESAEI